MDNPTCKDCTHFRQHYVPFDEFRFTETPFGHCVFPQLKNRRSNTPACVHYQKREKEETRE